MPDDLGCLQELTHLAQIIRHRNNERHIRRDARRQRPIGGNSSLREATLGSFQGSPCKTASGADPQDHCRCNLVEPVDVYGKKQGRILAGKLPCPPADEQQLL